jgi:hypothetical protein
MSGDHEQFISYDGELRHIREKKLEQLKEMKEKKKGMSTEPAHVTDATFDDVVSKNSIALIDYLGKCLSESSTSTRTLKQLSASKFSAFQPCWS